MEQDAETHRGKEVSVLKILSQQCFVSILVLALVDTTLAIYEITDFAHVHILNALKTG